MPDGPEPAVTSATRHRASEANRLALCPGCGEGLIVPDRFSHCGNCGLWGDELEALLRSTPIRWANERQPLVLGGQGKDADEVRADGQSFSTFVLWALLIGAAIGACCGFGAGWVVWA